MKGSPGHLSALYSQGIARSVHALAVNPQSPSILYAGTDPDGVYRSEDGGLTWSGQEHRSIAYDRP